MVRALERGAGRSLHAIGEALGLRAQRGRALGPTPAARAGSVDTAAVELGDDAVGRGLVEAAAILVNDGFEVFPYCTEDLGVAMRLVDAGCRVVMPWAAPIGSARGITNRDALRLLRDRLPDVTLVVDAGLGAPSHAAQALELGYDAVLLNTAVAKAADPVAMANAFRLGVEAGRTAYEAGLMDARDFASPSTPVVGTPFWHAVS